MIEATKDFESEFHNCKEAENNSSSGDLSSDELDPLVKSYFRLQALGQLVDMEFPDPDLTLHSTLLADHLFKLSLPRRQKIMEMEARHRTDDYKRAAIADLSEIKLLAQDADFVKLEPPQRTEIQDRLDHLRDTIQACEDLDDDHRHRLLRKSTELQNELNKEVSSYYRGLGMFVDLCDAVGEGGKKLKPAFDRAKEAMDMLKFFKKENARIEADPKPLQIEDQSKED